MSRSDKTRRIGDPRLAARLRREIEGEVLFDAGSRGRYSTDASIYQIEPIGVVVPRGIEDVVRTIRIAAEEDVPVLPRGAGTSQCGQTVGEAVIIDVSKYLNRLLEVDPGRCTAVVEPGLVLDELNRQLKPRGLMFAVDVSTSSRATLGGMTGNNSCGTRSIVYGTMRDNVMAIDAVLDDGSFAHLGVPDGDADQGASPARLIHLTERLLALGRREAGEIAARFPDLMRRVGGYNIDALAGTGGAAVNLAHLLVGSEGTLAFSRRLHLRLHPVVAHKVLGVCHFPSLARAMEATRRIVALGPSAVELVDHTLLELAREIPLYRSTIEGFVRGAPQALLLVEFADADRAVQIDKLARLGELMGELGLAGSVVEATEPALQGQIWEVRKAGLNIMMSMKGDAKPVSFIEDCAVRVEDLPEYTERLTRLFEKHGTTGTWYAHASVGCLHVRPVLNVKREAEAAKMRALAEEAFAIVREYQGSHSGEHGDGLVRSEFHAAMFGQRMVDNFREVKALFDPRGLFNPGKIVDPPAMDDRSLFRFKPDYAARRLDTALDWSAWGGFAGAVEMCNNNGACRKLSSGVMCPSYRATRNERDLTRGRANTLRLALSGQLGEDALTAADLYETLRLCVSCKGCRRECPTGVDMAKMKIEYLYQYRRTHRLNAHERTVAYLPRYAPTAARFPALFNLRNRSPALRRFGQRWLGFSAARDLPQWARAPFVLDAPLAARGNKQVALFADTFNRYFEPGNLAAAARVLSAAGYSVVACNPVDGIRRPLCCGRTFLAAGLVDEARHEAQRVSSALQPLVERGVPIVGLEPSCVLGFRDEYRDLLPAAQAGRLAQGSFLFEEFIAREHAAGRLGLELVARGDRDALLHGHCHQKAFGVMDAVTQALRLVPGLTTQSVDAGCCGMAGAFGYHRRTHDISVRMAELELAPAIRAVPTDTLVIASGTSCRQQIRDVTGRDALHVATVLAQALDNRPN